MPLSSRAGPHQLHEFATTASMEAMSNRRYWARTATPACRVHQGQPAPLHLQLGRHDRAADRRQRGHPHRREAVSCRPRSTRAEKTRPASRQDCSHSGTATPRSARARSRRSPESSPSAAKGSASDATAAPPSPTTTPETNRGSSPAASDDPSERVRRPKPSDGPLPRPLSRRGGYLTSKARCGYPRLARVSPVGALAISAPRNASSRRSAARALGW